MDFFLLGHTSRIDASVLSGGAWNSLYPLGNLQDPILAYTAISIGTAPASSTIVVDCGAPVPIRTLGLANHNLRPGTAMVRLEGSNSPTFAPLIADSLPVTVYPDSVRPDCPTFGLALAASATARYWRITLSDAGNPAGFISLGRVFLGDGWQPAATNFNWGRLLGVENPSVVNVLPSGRRVVERRQPFRTTKYKFEDLTRSESLNGIFLINWTHGLDREVLPFEDPADTGYRAFTTFLATMRQLSEVEWPHLNGHNGAFEFIEIVV